MSASSAGQILRHTHDRWVELIIDNPGQRNALTPTMLGALGDDIRSLDQDPDIRAVVLRGAAGVFSSGYAIDRFPDSVPEVDEIEVLCSIIEDSRLPVVAAVAGVCVGAALDVACACDIRVFTRSTRVGITPARMGLVYGWQGTARLRRVAGESALRYLLLSGQLVAADSRIGRRFVTLFVDEVDDAEREDPLGAAVSHLAGVLRANAPLSVSGSKETLRALSAPLDDTLAGRLHELRLNALGSVDCAEAQAAFAERRSPRFTGR